MPVIRRNTLPGADQQMPGTTSLGKPCLTGSQPAWPQTADSPQSSLITRAGYTPPPREHWLIRVPFPDEIPTNVCIYFKATC